ncbi:MULTISPECIES: flagellar hook protein FlgE [unclassified Leisingera]|uniref:flagellar hook protein FlgE n=1 Tax=unclassified Leisingera TaxID=2614906 RepID=UPI00101104A6|nr:MULTISPECIES: flagellar hook-basal body complex protein [unclassified Leisingera]MBQ4823322.1 flagellar hook-basal body complex protein [Leisingera sp. HS039]MCF6433447.1 flagellar hook-basal body complex protein [Leisingera sp. MMG026]QAX31522.1 flagellar hook-basal body complex protein [Leisingera sp. NJS204]QBR38152.1 flagellar hook-basal body complex protein [Leisingera sp. NJS201]
MTISSSLNAGVSGLSANASRLASISDNIANSSTRGYKRVETDFHSMVLSNSGGTYSAGGVRTTNVRLIDERGPLVSTNNATDLAVRGRGMLPVASITEVEAGGDPLMMLTTTGSFRTDSNGYLTTESGLVLMGWPALADGTVPDAARDTSDALEPIHVDLNRLSAEPTTEISLTANLPADETDVGASGDPVEQVVLYYDNMGNAEELTITYTPNVATLPATSGTNEWTMEIVDSATGAANIGEYTLTFDDSSTTGGSLASVATVTGGAYDGAAGSVTINVAGGPVEINIGTIGGNTGMSQLGDEFVPGTTEKDGNPVGSFVSVEINESGEVIAEYDSGDTKVIYKVPLADVSNVNGMRALDSQTYMPTDESGDFYLWDAGDGPTGEILGYAQEESAVDVATELTDMIQTQRAYSSNAKVIQTVDEMLQETTNIKR